MKNRRGDTEMGGRGDAEERAIRRHADTETPGKGLKGIHGEGGKTRLREAGVNAFSQSRRVCISFCLLCLLMSACAKQYVPPAPAPTAPPPGLKSQKPYQINGIWYYPLPSAEGYVEDGLASWYGPECSGKPTACGEPYNMWANTAAHKTLPLGTCVKVTNFVNGRSTILRINDRGPFVSGRIIDLSVKGAQDLDSYRKGLARVRVEAVQCAAPQVVGDVVYWKADPVPSFRYGKFTVQIGAFRDQGNAYRLRDKLSKQVREIRVTDKPVRDGVWYRVQAGLYTDLVVAKAEMDRFRSNGFPDAFVIAVEEGQ